MAELKVAKTVNSPLIESELEAELSNNSISSHSELNIADQLRLSPEGKASSDSDTMTTASGSKSTEQNSQNDYFASDNSCFNCSFLPVGSTGAEVNPQMVHLSSRDILNSGNPNIRVVVGAPNEEEKCQNVGPTGSQNSCNNAEAKWTSKTTTTTTVTPLHPLQQLEASVVAATTGHLYAFNKMTTGNGLSQQSTSSQQHLSPKSTFSGPPAGTRRKTSPSRRRYGPPRSRGNSPSNLKPMGTTTTTAASQLHNSTQQRSLTHLQPNSQHVVLLHVNPGETISFQIGEQVQLFQGPATVRMVSSNSTPPVPMPVQVPPGHMVQQIVDENGTLRHIILSPQPTTITMPPMHHHGPHHMPGTAGSSGTSSTYSGGNSSNNSGPSSGPTFFGYPPPPPSFVAPQFSSPHLQGSSNRLSPPPAPSIISHNSSNSPSHSGNGTFSNQGQYHHVHHHHHHHHAVNNCNTNHQTTKMADQGGFSNRDSAANISGSATSSGSNSSSSNNVARDERAQKQFFRLKKKLEARNQKESVLIFPPALNPGGILSHPMMTATPTTAFLISPANSPKKGINHQNKSSYIGNSAKSDYVVYGENSCNDQESHLVEETLSKIEAPVVLEIESRECRVNWKAPNLQNVDGADKEKGSSTSALLTLEENFNEITETDLKYELYISDRKINFDLSAKDGSFKLVYSGTLLECSVDDLKPGTEYYFAVRALTGGISGALSKSTTCRTKCSEPDQPIPPKLMTKARTCLTLKWSPPFDNRSRITNYILESDNGVQGEDIFIEVFSGLQKQFKLTKLNPSTVYRFRLAACNSIGKSEYSEIVFFSTSGSAPIQPLAPTFKYSTVTQIHLEWQKRISMDEDFTLQMEDETTRHGFLAAYNGRETNFVCDRLKRNLEYKFRLCANNEEGSSPWSQIVSFSTLPDCPGCPGKPALKGKIHSNYFKIEWDKPKDDGGSPITGYSVEIDKGSGFEIIYKGLENECQCDSLSPGTTYCMRVACTSIGGISQFSETTCITTQPVGPGRCSPPRLHGKPKALLLHLKWGAPDYDGGSPITEYEVNLTSPDNTSRQAYLGLDTDCMVAGLLPGRPYLFRVRASNRIGAGAWSETFETVSGAGPPDAPYAINIVSKSPYSIQLNWTEPVNNGATITDYRIEWTLNNNNSQDNTNNNNFTQLYLGPNTFYEIKNLTPASSYSFQIQAINSAGAGLFSSVMECVSLSSSPAVVSSSSINLIDSWPNSFSLNWKEPFCHGSPILYYNVEVTCAGGETILNTANQTETIIQNLNPETTYRVRIQAVNNIGPGSYSSSIKITTKGLPPPAPFLECISASHNSLRLKWGEGKNIDFIQYTLEMQNRIGNFLPIYQGVSQSHKVSKLRETTSYNFRIMASSDSGDGPYSTEFVFHTIITVPPVLRNPKITWHSFSICQVEWTSVKLATSDDPISYIIQLQKQKDGNYEICYQGTNLSFTFENLQPKSSNAIRGAAVRHCNNGETIQGAWCSLTSLGFPEGYNPHPENSSLSHHSSRGGGAGGGGGAFSSTHGVVSALVAERKPLTDQQWAVIILCIFTIFAVSVAMVIERLIS